jgi:4-hydroxybenzoate polyprenyltransferase
MKNRGINLRLNPFDILFLLRPPMLVPVWAFFLAGYWRTSYVPLATLPAYIRTMLTPRGYFWLSFVSFSLLMGAVYIINQIVDRDSDRVNEKLFLIPLGIVPPKLAYAMVLVLSVLSFSMGWFFGVYYMILLALSFCIGVLYSVRPFRLKGRPIIDVFSNAVGYGVLAFGIGWITDDLFSIDLMVRSIPYFFAAATIFTTSTILDTEGDRRDGAMTTAVKFGTTPTLVVSLVALLAALVSAILVKDYVIVVTSIIGLPLILVAIIKKERQFVTLYMRGASYVFVLLMAVLFPWFFVLLLVVFFASKLYYKFRFRIDYPSLLEKGA